jgi:hypothetical protein
VDNCDRDVIRGARLRSGSVLPIDRVTRGAGAKIAGSEIKVVGTSRRFSIPEKQRVNRVFAHYLALGAILASPLLQTGEFIWTPDGLGNRLRGYHVYHLLILLLDSVCKDRDRIDHDIRIE